jgi:hypothetical protein
MGDDSDSSGTSKRMPSARSSWMVACPISRICTLYWLSIWVREAVSPDLSSPEMLRRIISRFFSACSVSLVLTL